MIDTGRDRRLGPLTAVTTLAVLLVFQLSLLLPGTAWSQDAAEAGLHLKNDLGVRIVPAGARMLTDIGYRLPLSDSANILLDGSYFSAGVATNLSPVFAWAGLYAEILPVQVLKLRVSAQRTQYFGVFGFLPDAQRTEDGFQVPTLDQTQGVSDGDAAGGWLFQASATPRLRWKGIVFESEFAVAHAALSREDYYYEPLYDIVLASTDTLWEAKPTLGYMFDFGADNGDLVAAIRFDHTRTIDSNVSTDLLLGILQWGIPPRWWEAGNPRLAVVGGAWTAHSERAGHPFVATQLSLEFGP